MKIPFFDLKAHHETISIEINTALNGVFESSNFIAGSVVSEFENAFAHAIGVRNCISCANGTDSLEIILRALNIKKGDEVIVPAISWISTAEAVSIIGAEPIFVDVESQTGLIDVDKIIKAVTPKTKAIIPVHLYGNACNMDAIMDLAEGLRLFVVEDCAQAHLAEFQNKKVGSFGHAASFSFYPTKNLGAIGDAGAILTKDDELAMKCRMLANHGQMEKHDFQFIGRNSRMDTIQAAILSAKLPFLEKWTEKRINIAAKYSSILTGSNLAIPTDISGKRHVYHLYVIQSLRRDELIEKLSKENIGYAIHYPMPLPFLKPYLYKSHVHSEFQNALNLSNQCLSLPIFPELNDDQIQLICNTLLK